MSCCSSKLVHGHLIVCPLLMGWAGRSVDISEQNGDIWLNAMKLKAPFVDVSLKLRTLVADGRDCARNIIMHLMMA